MSRELDALVEKYIFDKDPRCYDCPHFDEKGRMLSFCNCPEMPHRSTDLNAAKPIIDKLAELGYWAELRTPFGKDEYNDGYWCGFTPHLTTGWNGIPDHWTQAETMPEAICIAGLAVVGIDAEVELKEGA